jgi:hypothetical protein
MSASEPPLGDDPEVTKEVAVTFLGTVAYYKRPVTYSWVP